MAKEEPTEEEGLTSPTKPDDYRKKWEPILEKTPSGLTVLMGWLDPLEYLLLYVDDEKVAEYERNLAASNKELTKEAKQKIEEDEVKAQIKLLSTIIKDPKIVDGKAGPGELSFQEIRPVDRRFLLRKAQQHIGLAGREALLTKFRRKQQRKETRGRNQRKIRDKTVNSA